MIDSFVELLQVVIGNRSSLSRIPSEKEWKELYAMSQKQSVGAFVFTAIDQLGNSGQKPPMSLLYEWIGLSEQVRLQNIQMNKEAALLTRLFEQAGHYTAILKGQANARLYKQPLSRQPGDIDIWVDGGREKVVETVQRLGLSKEEMKVSYHDVHLQQNGIEIEVHFRPSSGNLNPFTNKRLQAFLEKEIDAGCLLVEDGFRVPSIRFALVMQLAHIQRHLLSEGVGIRQVIDYYYLLKSDFNKERDDVFYLLKSFGLNHIAEALMWLLHEIFGLEKSYLLAPMDEKRGRMLLHAIMNGGNFGQHYFEGQEKSLLGRMVANHKKRLQMLQFDVPETLCNELYSFYCFFKRVAKA